MNKTLVITTIALIAVVMGLSTIAPALQEAFAHNVKSQLGPPGSGLCPDAFVAQPITTGTHPDHNHNGIVCVKISERFHPGNNMIDDLPNPQ